MVDIVQEVKGQCSQFSCCPNANPASHEAEIGSCRNVSSYKGRITLPGGKLEDNIKMNPKGTQCLDMEWT
jgi:hypothetical protein